MTERNEAYENITKNPQWIDPDPNTVLMGPIDMEPYHHITITIDRPAPPTPEQKKGMEEMKTAVLQAFGVTKDQVDDCGVLPLIELRRQYEEAMYLEFHEVALRMILSSFQLPASVFQGDERLGPQDNKPDTPIIVE